jgi:hypothetical protein
MLTINPNAIETIELPQNLIAEVVYDADNESPREWGNLGTIVCWHNRRHFLGDVQPDCSAIEYLYGLMNDREFESKRYYLPDLDVIGEDNILKYFEKHFVFLSLCFYDHGGIAMSTSTFSCPWDSGRVGFIYVERDSDEVAGMTEQKIIDALKQEVKIYDTYLRGEVLCVDIKDRYGEVINSCGGFYAMQEAKQWLSDEYELPVAA